MGKCSPSVTGAVVIAQDEARQLAGHLFYFAPAELNLLAGNSGKAARLVDFRIAHGDAGTFIQARNNCLSSRKIHDGTP